MKAYENARASMIAGVYGSVTSEEVQPLLADFAPVQTCITELGTHINTLDRLIAVQSDNCQRRNESGGKLAV